MNTAGLIDALQYAILPVLAFPLVGFVMGRRGLFSPEAARGANAYVVALALPAMLFLVIARADLTTVEPLLIAVYLGAECSLYALVYAVMRHGFGRPRREAALIGMAASFPNHVFLALPIATALYGEVGASVVASMVVFDVTLVFGGTIILLESLRGEQSMLRTLGDILTNRLLLALAAAVAWNLSGAGFHAGIERFLSLAGASATPTALFALGVMLSTTDLRRIGPSVWGAVAAKLVLHPAVALIAFGAMVPAGTIWVDPSLLVFAAPCSAMAFVLGLRYNVDVEIIMKAILASTALSVVSFALLA